MKFFKILNNHRNIYLIIYFLILLHFAGGFVSNLAILITSILIFVYILFAREWDLYLIFLLLIPSIAFSGTSISDVADKASPLTQNFKSVWIIGPLALSAGFAMALAIPIRLLLDFSKSKHQSLIFIWFINLLLAITGLIVAVINKQENPSGITVGLRIALTTGAILIQKKIIDKEHFLESIDRIVLVSLFLLLFGLLKGHWYFVLYAFIPYVWYRIRPRLLIVIPIIVLMYILVNARSNTITMLGILVFSFIFYFIINSDRSFRSILKSRLFVLLLLIIPLIITLLVISMGRIESYDEFTLRGYIEFKLLGDRKPIWDASWKDIWTSSFFFRPAGNHLKVYFDYLHTWQNWTAGSHNMFLEIGRQLNAFSMISLSFILLYLMYTGSISLMSKRDMILYYCFISVYLVLGLTGQSLIYDGTGALFWLIFGQMQHIPDVESSKD